MSPERSVRTRLSRLLVESRHELDALSKLADELARYRAALDEPAVERPVLALVAVDLHDYYTAAETLFERVARWMDGDVPSGTDSHRELIEQMAIAVPPLRPAVLSDATRNWLHRLRAFRHFFRHAYAVDLDPVRLREHAESVSQAHPGLVAELESMLAFVERTRDALPVDP